jgi:plastocyanin
MATGRTFFVAAAFAIALGATGEGGARADVINVYVFDFDFSINQPGEPIVDAVIDVGDIVQWVALAEFHDTVAAAGQAEFWQSPLFQQPGDVFDYQFNIPGVYHYYCSPHGFDNGDGTAGGMSGTITVLPAPGSALVLLGAGAVLAGRRRRDSE